LITGNETSVTGDEASVVDTSFPVT
jgi:hypothetical protein